MIVIIDYGIGNLGSVLNMLKYIGADAIISNKPDDILKAKKLILPGIGAFGEGIKNLITLGFIDILNEKVLIQKTPILGICLGMQLMTQYSEESDVNGLGWFDAKTVRFKFPEASLLKIPHMGWNEIVPVKDSILLESLPDPKKFYFVHSYYVKESSNQDVIAECYYGSDFACALEKENIFATQFHPEKSHKYGIKLLKNFVLV